MHHFCNEHNWYLRNKAQRWQLCELVMEEVERYEWCECCALHVVCWTSRGQISTQG